MFGEGQLSLYPHVREGVRELSGVSSKGTDPIHGATPSRPNHLPRPCVLIPSHWGLGFQHVSLGGHSDGKYYLGAFYHSFQKVPWGNGLGCLYPVSAPSSLSGTSTPTQKPRRRGGWPVCLWSTLQSGRPEPLTRGSRAPRKGPCPQELPPLLCSRGRRWLPGDASSVRCL